MKTFGNARSYTEYDRIALPEGILALGAAAGSEGIINRLDYQHNNVYADVTVTYSTQEPRGSVFMEITPKERVLSYSVGA
ncbi:MAG: hypothetical protein H0U04_14970 [Rubrobacter sp.]|nr:hypothetical protein [Rubrobacter sp.]